MANRGPVNFTRRDNGLNQYVNWTPAAILYDDNFGSPYVFPGNGVMMAEGWITASYNALNQPMAIWSQNYGLNFLWLGFDPLGRCVKRWTGTVNGVPVGSNPTTYFYYDGWNLVQERLSTTVADRTYVHGGRVDEIVASQADGVWYNHHYDGQGNCILLSTTSGGSQEQYDYDAFGFPYFYNASGGPLNSPPRTRFLFTGREWLSDLRIYDYRARQYQPELGRFLQPDPKEFEAGDYNLYRYCHNDPVNKIDPTGLTWADLMRWQRGGDGTVSEQAATEGARRQAMERARTAFKDPRVRAEVTKAWTESNPYSPDVYADRPGSTKVEQGGWAIKESDGYKVVRVPPGTRDSLETILGTRPNGEVVFWFHTHPSTKCEGYRPDKGSIGDWIFTRGEAKVPGLILGDEGFIWLPYP